MTASGGYGYDDEASPGAAGRRAVSAAAPVAFVLSLAGAVAGIADLDAVGLALMAAGVVTGIWCLWHGARHAHERGRAFAVLAVVVGLLFGSLLLWGRVRGTYIL